jgi:signal peptidase I
VGGDDQQNTRGAQSEAGKSGPYATANGNDRDDQQQSACDRSQQKTKFGEPDSGMAREREQKHGGQFPSSSGRHWAPGQRGIRGIGRTQLDHQTQSLHDAMVRTGGLVTGLGLMLLLAGCGGSSRNASSHRLLHYTVPNPSMEPTLKSGSHVTIREARFTPRLGEIVAFYPPTTASPTNLTCVNIDQGPGQPDKQPCGTPAKRKSRMIFVQRIVGMPGDRIAVSGGHVVRNGVPQKEPYIEPCGGVAECDLPKPIVVPSGHYFLMGDNRGQASDSRFWGPLPREWIIGLARR